MMNIKEIELNEEGKIVALKGTIKRDTFNKFTDKVYFWSYCHIDYMGG